MKRNNSSRLGDLDQDTRPTSPDTSVEAAAVAKGSAGLAGISFVTATDVVDLPSAGIFYPDGHPLEGQTSIEMRHMTAKEEDILTNTAFIRNGTVLDKMLNSLIVDTNINLDSLIVGDKNALLLSARINAYGNEYAAKVNCPVCSSNQTFEIDLGEIRAEGPNELMMALEETEITANKTIIVTTPKTNLIFELRPMIGADEKYLTAKTKKYKKLKITKTVGLIDNFALITVSINGETDPHQIKEVYEKLPAFDFRHIRKAYAASMPDIELLAPLTCCECGAEEVIGVPLNATFFWPDVKI
jgi:hypothetical protein